MRRTKASALLFFAVLMLTHCTSTGMLQQVVYDSIQSDFTSPSHGNTLWCYWYWIGDDISKEGITKDLQAMKEAGIGAAFIGNINPAEEDGNVPMLSEDWWGHMVHAVNEGKRLGVDIGSFNCPGWSMSGGPWISSDKAMRHLVYSETSVTGGKKVEVQLELVEAEFQDVAVLAFPKCVEEDVFLSNSNSKIEIIPAIDQAEALLDGNKETGVDFLRSEYTIDIKSTQPIAAKSIRLLPKENNLVADCELQAFIGGEFTTVKKFNFDRRDFKGQVGPIPYGPLTIAFPSVQSDQFRLICKNIRANGISGFSEIIISEALVVEKFLGKTLGRMHPTPQPSWNSYSWESAQDLSNKELAIVKEEVLDISDKIDKEGKLSWDAPEGEWTVMRFGMTPTGTKNHPSAPRGRGYEVDKANRELIRFHFEQFIGEFLKRIPADSKSAFKYVIADSYEMGSQNWTDGFEQSFKERYGYSPMKYLPVFSGRVIGSVTESNRFLWDLRRAIADDVAYKYTGGLREIANEHGLKLWLENYGHWGFPSEFLMYGGQSDFVSGEYWNEGTLGDIECKAASSAAHIYGKKTTSAECFTASQRTYVRHPAMLKKRGDWSLTQGINHHVLHVYIHQPDDRVPGVNAWFSTEFNRHNTWFKQGKAYFDYLRRAQHMLQQGRYVADVCYFIGEDAPIMTGATIPTLPSGYSFDYINAEVIISRMSVRGGRFLLPDGMSYEMMILPPIETMRPELLMKIEQLVAKGGKVYGQAPTASPSLQNYPYCDEQVVNLASKLWWDGEAIKRYGKGAVISDIPLQEALDAFDIERDVEVSDEVLWTHRHMDDMEIYFLTNQGDKEIMVTPSFRVDGLKPQLWDAVTGEIRGLLHYKVVNGRTILPLRMEVGRSWFVVFTNESNQLMAEGYRVNTPTPKVVQTIESPWNIDFDNQKIAPKNLTTTKLFDWSKNEHDLLKHYSGSTNYSTSFQYHGSILEDVFIDLGQVGVMATVVLNGQNIGTTWMAPYRLNVSGVIRKGANALEITVVNVWRNRLTGDKKLPEEERTTSIAVDQIAPEEELITSGLLGPVTIMIVDDTDKS